MLSERNKIGYTVSFISIVLNFLLFGLKFYAGQLTDSIALTADAWHTLSDSLSSVAVLFAIKLASRKPDREHPFGHGRWEQIAALFISFLLVIIAYDFLRDSLVQISDKKIVNYGILGISVTIVSIFVKEGLAQYSFYIAKKTENLSIKADGWHHRTDAISSVVVLAGILFAKQYWWIDCVLGSIISLMLFYASYEIAEESITKLLGEKPSSDLIQNIKEIAFRVTGLDLHLHHFHIHNYVSRRELTFHIKLENSLSIEKAHLISTSIERAILKDLFINATIHIEPINYNHPND